MLSSHSLVRTSTSLSLTSALSCVALAMVGAMLGCSSDPGAPQQPETTTSPTTPAEPQSPADTTGSDTPMARSTLAMSPSCGGPDTRVMLQLDWTIDKRVPECVRAEDFEVRFGTKLARITKLGKMNEGWCALDVLVPKGAESAVVSVTVGHDVFESKTSFAGSCR